MPVSAVDLATSVSSVLSGLVPADGDPRLITKAERAVRSALQSGQTTSPSAGPGGMLLTNPLGFEPVTIAVDAAKGSLIARRDLQLQPLTGPGAVPAWTIGRAKKSIGPFLGSLGQNVFIDVFDSATRTELRRASSADPFLIWVGASTWDANDEAHLTSGSLWLRAAPFDSAVPADGWVGITASSGMITGGIPTSGGGGALIIADTATLVVTLVLNSPTPATGSGPGGDARSAAVQTPGTVTFTLTTSSTTSATDNAQLTAYGQQVGLLAATGPANYVAELRSIVVAMKPDASQFLPNSGESTLVTLSGGGAIGRAGWALAVSGADPASLGPAGGSGGLAIEVGSLALEFAALGDSVPLGLAWLSAIPGQLMITADAAEGTGFVGSIGLYSAASGGVGGLAQFRFDDQFPVRYLTDATGLESVLALARFSLSLDRPVTARGDRLPLELKDGLLAFEQTADAISILIEGSPNESIPLTIALDNALLSVGGAALVIIRAVQTSVHPLRATIGAAGMLLPLRGALPTLPDPYISTVVPQPAPNFVGAWTNAVDQAGATREAGASGGKASWLVALLGWDQTAGEAAPTLTFAEFGLVGVLNLEPTPPGAASTNLSADAVFATSTPVENDVTLLAGLARLVEQSSGSTAGGIALLDVSSNSDQFGVRYPGKSRGKSRGNDRFGANLKGPRIEGLSLVAPANQVRIITLPAVQWEPITDPNGSGSFTPMSFPNSGGESQFISHSVTLVELAPTPMLEQLVADFSVRAAPQGATVAVTFPYGIRAVAALEPPRGLIGVGSTLDLHRPNFTAQSVIGGFQIRATAVRRFNPYGAPLAFPGATVQLSNGRHAGLPTHTSAIDPLTKIFNDQFGTGKLIPGVPVSQFEVSGYGESVFSDWKNDSDTVPGISEVRFDVAVGRDIIEVVQARSILYPYGVRVMRTIKMLRQNSGRVNRIDSGWVAVTDGRYQWPRPEMQTHPGVVLGATEVMNIRDTGLRWTTSQGTELTAVRFDCKIDLAGLTTGAGKLGVSSHDQLGFVQISDNALPGMSPIELAELIAQFGAMGGSVDALVTLGTKGAKSRVTRVGVGVSQGASGPEFVMSAWGSPVLPTGGSWSVVRTAAGQPAPGPVDAALGVPLIREGVAGAMANPGSPLRFADPADLLSPDSPEVDYALMHSTPVHRTLYPRPKVELTGSRASEFSSTQPPVVADAILLATAVGSFPPVASAIHFPDADYGLVPSSSGGLALDLAHNDFPVTGGDRILSTGANNTTFLRYKNEGGAASTVHVELDSAAAVPWKFTLSDVEVGFSTALMGEVMRILGTIDGAANRAGTFLDGSLHFGGALAPVGVILDFLGDETLKAIPIGSQNQPTLEIGLKIPIVGAPGEPSEIDIGIGALADADVTVGVKVDLAGGDTSVKFELDAIVTGTTPFPPLVVAGQIKVEIESSTAGNVFKLTLGVGAGVNIPIGPFKAEAYYFENNYLIIGTNEIGYGVGEEIKATLDLDVASVEIDVEAAAYLIITTCAGRDTTWLVAQLTIGVDVTIAWVIDINFEYQMQTQANLNGGPCAAPMV